jgi:hypothetical protein
LKNICINTLDKEDNDDTDDDDNNNNNNNNNNKLQLSCHPLAVGFYMYTKFEAGY